MAASKTDKDAYSLISLYISLYRDKYNLSPIVNKYKEKWAMNSLIEDFSKDDVEKTLSYYFRLSKDNHPLTWFYNNFSSIHMSRISAEKDDRLRSAAREKTQQLRAEYLDGIY